MSNRHLARSVAMQTLYEWDFNHQDGNPIKSGIVARDLTEFATGLEDGGFAQSLVEGVLQHQSEIDALIVKYAPEWPLNQITLVDRNILRLGVYELKFVEDIPSKVAINEAIELAKGFGGNSSSKFVNGVLGAIYRDMAATNQLKKADTEMKEKEKEEEPEKKKQ